MAMLVPLPTIDKFDTLAVYIDGDGSWGNKAFKATVLIGTTKELMKTKRELEKSLEQSKINESESYFFAKGIKFLLTGTRRSENGKTYVHSIKNTSNNKTSEMSDVKYLEIITKFGEENKHLK